MRRCRVISDRGAAAVEAAILTPVIVMLLAAAVVVGVTSLAQSTVDNAAFLAARTASLDRDPTQAAADGKAAAREIINAQGLNCAPLTITVDVSQFAKPLGQPAVVTATISCRTGFGAFSGLPGVGAKTLTASFTSALDQWRGRAGT